MQLRAEGAKSLADYLENEITAGHMPAGFKLPAERELGEQFHLSRGSVLQYSPHKQQQGECSETTVDGIVFGYP